MPHGWTIYRTVGDVTQWTRPGKDTGCSATTGLRSGNGTELLCVFSTNAAPLEGINSDGRPGRTYSKFAAYAALNHSGDYAAAARELARRGYGSRGSRSEQSATQNAKDIPSILVPEGRTEAAQARRLVAQHGDDIRWCDPWLLNTLNGTLNLHTGQLREHRRDDLITKLAPVEYPTDAGDDCPVWQDAIDNILSGDSELIEYMQRLLATAQK